MTPILTPTPGWDSWFESCEGFAVEHSNDGGSNWIGTGLYLWYGTEGTVVDLMLKAVDKDGNEISGILNAELFSGETYLGWIANTEVDHTTRWPFSTGESTITD